ncbi:MAG: hypothetical protein ACNA8W_18560, partial [Bradymonadaceae bacterium]
MKADDEHAIEWRRRLSLLANSSPALLKHVKLLTIELLDTFTLFWRDDEEVRFERLMGAWRLFFGLQLT